MHWRRKWQPTPVFLPGESQRRGSLMGCHLWGRTESDTTEATCSSSSSLDKYTLREKETSGFWPFPWKCAIIRWIYYSCQVKVLFSYLTFSFEYVGKIEENCTAENFPSRGHLSSSSLKPFKKKPKASFRTPRFLTSGLPLASWSKYHRRHLQAAHRGAPGGTTKSMDSWCLWQRQWELPGCLHPPKKNLEDVNNLCE